MIFCPQFWFRGEALHLGSNTTSVVENPSLLTRRRRKELNTMAVSFEGMFSVTRRPTRFCGYWSHYLATGQPGDKNFHIPNCRGHKYNHNNICYIFVWKLQWSSDVQYYYYWSETEITLPLFYLLFCFFFRKVSSSYEKLLESSDRN